MSCRIVLSAVVALSCAGFAAVHAQEKQEAPTVIQPEEVKLGRPVEFNRDIYPILENNCVACHNLAIAESRLNLEDIEGIMKGGRRGPSVVVKEPDQSLLYQVAAHAKKPVMPPVDNDVEADPLTPRELGLLRQWILEGAVAGERMGGAQVQWNALPEGLNAIHAVDMSESVRVVAAGHGNQIDLYDLDSGQHLQRLVDPNLDRLADADGQKMYPGGAAHRDFVNAIAITADGRTLASGGYRSVKIWQRTQPQPVVTWELPAAATAMAASAEGGWIAVAHADGVITTWNRETGEPGPVLKGHSGAIVDLAFTPSLSQRLAIDSRWQAAAAAAAGAARQDRVAREALERFMARVTSTTTTEEQKQKLTDAVSASAKALADAQQSLAAAEEERHRFELQAQARSRLVTAGADQTVRIWDFKGTASQTLTVPAPCTALAVDPTGIRIATAHEDNVIRLWDLSKPGEEAQQPIAELKGHTATVTALDFTPADGKQLVSGSEDKSVRVWNAADGKPVRSLDLGGPVSSLSLRPDGAVVAAGGASGATRAWTIADGKQLFEVSGAVERIQNVAQLTQEAEVAKKLVALADQAIQAAEKLLKERQDSKTKAEEELKKATEAATKAETDEKTAATALAEATKAAEAKADDKALAKKKDDAQKKADEAAQALKTARDALASAKRNLDLSGKTLQRAEADVAAAKKRKAAAEKSQQESDAQLAKSKEAETQARQAVVAVEFTPDGRGLVTLLKDGSVQHWSATTGLGLGSDAPAPAISQLLFVSPEDLAVIAGQQLQLRPARTTWKLTRVLGPNPKTPLRLEDSKLVDRVLSLAFSRDGKQLATGGGDPSRSGELILWDVEEGTLVREFKEAHSDTVFGIEFSRDGKQLLSGAADKFVKVFDVATGEHVRSFEGHTNHVMDVAWMADGSRIVSAGADNAIKVWNTETGEQTRTISNYAKQVTSIGFVGVGEDIVSCGGDKTVRLHRTSNGQNLRTFSGAEDYMYAVAVSEDQSLVVAGGEDGMLRIWDGKTGQAKLTLDTSAIR